MRSTVVACKQALIGATRVMRSLARKKNEFIFRCRLAVLFFMALLLVLHRL